MEFLPLNDTVALTFHFQCHDSWNTTLDLHVRRNIMQLKKSSYWPFFNFVGKFAGLVLAIVGAVLCVWSVVAAISSPDKLSLMEAIVGGGVSAVVSVLGVLMIVAKPSHPKDFTEEI